MKVKYQPKQKQVSKQKAGVHSGFDKKLSNRYLIIVLILTAIAYLPVLKAGFINWDDNQYVYDNTMIRSFENLKELIITPLQGNYHPLTMISLAFNYAVSGYDAWSYHTLNLLLHLLNTFLVFVLALKLSKNNMLIATTTSLLFGVHPMHVESVAWVAERKDVLYSFFFLLGLISYVNYFQNKSSKAYLLSIIWLMLSLISKPAAVIFPIALFTIDLLLNRKMDVKLMLEKIPYFVLAIIMGILTFNAQKNAGATETIPEFGLLNRLFFGCYSTMMYFLKAIVPFGQTPFYPFPSTKNSLPLEYYLAPLFLVGVIILCLKTFHKTRVISFGFVFYFVNILLIAQFFIVGRAIIAERYTYMPYIGLFFMAGWMLDNFKNKVSMNPYYIVFAIGIIFTALAYRQSANWKNGETLWESAIKAKPGSRVYHNRGVLFRKEGNYDKAIEYYTKALTYHDDVIDDAILANRANIYFDKKDFERALVDYNEAIKLNPNDYQTYENRGSAYLMLKKYDLALADLNKSLSLKPSNVQAYNKIGILYMQNGRNDLAISQYLKYLERVDSDFEAMNALGVCYQSTKQYEESIKWFTKAIDLKNNPSFYLNRSYSNDFLGRTELARNDALAAKNAGFKVPQNYLQHLGL